MTDPTAMGTVAWPAAATARYRETGLWRDRNLAELLAAMSDADPDKPAVVDGATRLTYAQLIQQVEAGAAQLVGMGLRPDDRIVVQVENGWQFVVLLLACLRSGIVPVLALPAHREVEITAIARAAQARALVVPARADDVDHLALCRTVAAAVPQVQWIMATGLPGDAAGPGAPVIDLDALLARRDLTTNLPMPAADSPAFFLLSGGTTGPPKLISRTHNDYECNLRACSAVTRLNADSVYLVTLPAGHNFPLGCPGWLGTLLAGGTVVMLSSPRPDRVFDAVAMHRVTVTAAVPAVAQRWIDHARAHGRDQLRSLQVLQVGGSRMPDELARQVRPVLGCTLQQVFGMAEGLINMTRLDDPLEVVTTTQGRPVSPADEVRIVDAAGLDVPAGARGSILTRGPYTPCGYYDAPEANRRSFVGGWYSSGDIVERRSDGNLIVHGRDRDLINRGGEKISAEEIESLAYRIPQVRLAAAVAMPDPLLGERLCLYAVLRAGCVLDLDTVRAAMSQAGIARFKLPEWLEVVDEIPVTKVGKIDKAALRRDAADKSDRRLLRGCDPPHILQN